MKQILTVVKIGGNVIDDETSLASFLERFARLQSPKILVHGGGALATLMASRLNIPQQMINGRRVTDAATLEIVTMVYAGQINKNIIAGLQALQCNAIGLSGADGNLIKAHKRVHAEHDYGFAGDIDEVNGKLLDQLLEAGLTPVIAPITHDNNGQLLNTNADTVAREIAQALSETYHVKLVYCFEKNGVLRKVVDESSCIASINKNSFQELQTNGVVNGGMLPKLENAFAALDKGVQAVVIGKWEYLEQLVHGQTGTTIIHD